MDPSFHVLLEPNSDPTMQKLHQKSSLIRPANVFPVFCCSILVLLYEGLPQFLVLSLQELERCGHMLLICAGCAFKDAFLHISVIMSGYLECLFLSYQLKALWPFSSDPWHQQGIFNQSTATPWMCSDCSL